MSAHNFRITTLFLFFAIFLPAIFPTKRYLLSEANKVFSLPSHEKDTGYSGFQDIMRPGEEGLSAVQRVIQWYGVVRSWYEAGTRVTERGGSGPVGCCPMHSATPVANAWYAVSPKSLAFTAGVAAESPNPAARSEKRLFSATDGGP